MVVLWFLKTLLVELVEVPQAFHRSNRSNRLAAGHGQDELREGGQAAGQQRSLGSHGRANETAVL